VVERFDRLLWPEQRSAATGGPLTEQVKKLLAKHQRETLDQQSHLEASYPGYLGYIDTNLVGTLKGIGRIYAQYFSDANSAVAFSKLYLIKLSMTVVDLLHDRVLPFYVAQGVALAQILSDNGREYGGRPLPHPFVLSGLVQKIQHRTTKVGSPETYGMVERFHRTLKDEFFSLMYRRKNYDSVEALQADLDAFVALCNASKAHHGYHTQGRTPLQSLADHLVCEEVVPLAA
jgi:hypothetical protein